MDSARAISKEPDANDVVLIPSPESRAQRSLDFKRVLRRLTDSDPAYWDYSSVKHSSNDQAYFQYPAMMVPEMQGDIIDAIMEVFPPVKRTLDPFAGSGTILSQSLMRGLDSVAIDINPMALLLCKVKSQSFKAAEVSDAFETVEARSLIDRDERIGINYENRDKWFSDEALTELSRFQRAIASIEDIDVRRLLWVAFAEGVRLCSNSRTSTYKLHIRASDDMDRRATGVRKRLLSAMSDVVIQYAANFERLAAADVLEGTSFKAKATVLNHDMRTPLVGYRADSLVSSPPYGDNHTTVTYGQHSFLPLLWIPLSDIDDTVAASMLANTHSIDSASLGGRREDTDVKRDAVSPKSEALSEILDKKQVTDEAQKRLVAFFFDLDMALENAVATLSPRSPIVLTLGNRCVCGVRIPTDLIVQELLASYGCEFIDTHNRAIPTKRMAHRNKIADTMLTETLLAMRGPVE